MSLRTPLAQVRGLGSARQGAHHWWVQRITAAMLIPLFIWFVGTMITLATGGYTEAVELIRSPVVAGALLMLIVAIFYHAAFGLQVVIEDYISEKGTQISAIVSMRFTMILLAVISVVSVFKVAVGG
uniref:Succinate dehydrogenase hydrophobic membrane anchor subunit n=1 Tax=Candidatus Kentrum sp. LFY TaxID=2126342 RepID=A0A450UHZ8_9GAMM|nr:MAG: succinate dehydrogenase / fumarate reductase membrane anchor subunit [Candidatus Kentron sp. LFY]VFJ92161.1 MAG: succinate dehydrogenase / fumarate reductase membrane anchor subunit [Candidatus Kentron sp. LFY]VFK21129.1 MAG: succinate dehydrogenase / fumarate reductase membrane anchor subunit [Candidatus Kentron sp. LFY]